MNDREMRPVGIQIGFLRNVPGSALISFGDTRVLCTALLEEGVPPFRRGTGKGWLTAEYAMLPASTQRRKARDGARKDGRAVEIQRLIGRSLRACVDFEALGERTVYIDCDVLEADGGTRTASVTGAFCALAAGCAAWIAQGRIAYSPVIAPVAAVSVGIVEDEAVLDLDYSKDSRAQVDMNVVMTGGQLVEVQGTGEGRAFSRREMDALLDLAQAGIGRLESAQKAALGEAGRFVRAWAEPLVVATQNPGKLREMRAILGRYYGNVISLADAGVEEQTEENEPTFEGNAKVKAEFAAARTGFAALADDSGLEVDALGGEPGVYSARYAGSTGGGEERDRLNRELLLRNLAGVPGRHTARFVCAAALARPGTETVISRGTVEGRIIETPRGTDGFGYDPIFVADGDERTFAELSPREKNDKSHRRRAVDGVMERINN